MPAPVATYEIEAQLAQEIETLLVAIVAHAKDKTTPMTIGDLRDYSGQLMRLGKLYDAERAIQTFNMEKQVRRMSRLLQTVVEVLESSRQTTLITVWRGFIADYVNQAPKLSIE